MGVALEAYHVAKDVGSVCTGHDGLEWPVMVVFDDCV
jgi:hypothetical protein